MLINIRILIKGSLILLLIAGCKTIPFHPESFTQDYLVIGDGGGFTGVETSFFFTTSGNVYKHSGRDTIYQKIPKIKHQIVKQAIGSIELLDLMNYKYQNPGNVYKFLSMKIDGKSNKVVWGNSQEQVNPAIVNIYRLLHESLQNDK